MSGGTFGKGCVRGEPSGKLIYRIFDFPMINTTNIFIYFDRLRGVLRMFKLGWEELSAFDCQQDPLSFSSEYERFFICNLHYFQIFFGGLFVLLILPFLVSITLKLFAVVKFLWLVGRKIAGFIYRGIFQGKPAEEEPKETVRAPKIRKQPRQKKEWEPPQWFSELRGNLLTVEGSGRYLREIVFFEDSDENFGAPFWSAFFLLSTFVTPFVGLSFLVPVQMIISSLFGFYALYRLIRYRVLLDPKLPYYWEGKKGPGLYIFVAALSLLYATILFTAFALMEFFV